MACILMHVLRSDQNMVHNLRYYVVSVGLVSKVENPCQLFTLPVFASGVQPWLYQRCDAPSRVNQRRWPGCVHAPPLVIWVPPPEYYPIEISHWYVYRLGYGISVTIAPCIETAVVALWIETFWLDQFIRRMSRTRRSILANKNKCITLATDAYVHHQFLAGEYSVKLLIDT